MDISNFEKPTQHPYGMLSGYQRANEKESVLAFILSECINAGTFTAVKTRYAHPSMVADGLLREEGERRLYSLTTTVFDMMRTSIYNST